MSKKQNDKDGPAVQGALGAGNLTLGQANQMQQARQAAFNQQNLMANRLCQNVGAGLVSAGQAAQRAGTTAQAARQSTRRGKKAKRAYRRKVRLEVRLFPDGSPEIQGLTYEEAITHLSVTSPTSPGGRLLWVLPPAIWMRLVKELTNRVRYVGLPSHEDQQVRAMELDAAGTTVLVTHPGMMVLAL